MALSSQSKYNSVLNRSSYRTSPDSTAFPKHSHIFSPIQDKVDEMMNRFIDEATNSFSLAALMAGGIAYRLGKIGVMSMGVGVYGRTPAIFASTAVGLGSEVTAFEFTNRILHTVRAGLKPAPTNNLWNWSGLGGWKQGLLNDIITFGLLKGAGNLSRESNILFQHAFSSTAMVAGNQIAASFGITPKQGGSLAEQFLHAEMTNIQLGAGTSLVHVMAPGISSLERGLDLSLRSETPPLPLLQRVSRRDLVLAEGIDNIGAPLAVPNRDPKKNPLIQQMSAPDDPERKGNKTSQLERALPSDPPASQKRQPGVLFEKSLDELNQNQKIVTLSTDGRIRISLRGKKNLSLQDLFEFYQLTFHHALKLRDILVHLKTHGRDIQAVEPHIQVLDGLLQDAREHVLKRRAESARLTLEEVERQMETFQLAIFGIALPMRLGTAPLAQRFDFFLNHLPDGVMADLTGNSREIELGITRSLNDHPNTFMMTGEKSGNGDQPKRPQSSLDPSSPNFGEEPPKDRPKTVSLFWRRIAEAIGRDSPFDHPKVLEEWKSELGEFLLNRLRKREIRSYKICLQVQFDPKTQKIIKIEEVGWLPKKSPPHVAGFNYDVYENRLEVATSLSRKALKPYREFKKLIDSLEGTSPVFHRLTPEPNQEKIDFHLENLIFAKELFTGMTAVHETIGGTIPFNSKGLIFEPFLSVAPNGYFVGFQYRVLGEYSVGGAVHNIGLPMLGTLVGIEYGEYRNSLTKEFLKIPEQVIWESTPNKYQVMAIEMWRRHLQKELEKPGWVKK